MQQRAADTAKKLKNLLFFEGFCYINNFVLMSCWLHFVIDCERFSEPKSNLKWHAKAMKNRSKNHLKIDAILDQVVVEFGSILEAKLDPSLFKNRRKNE